MAHTLGSDGWQTPPRAAEPGARSPSWLTVCVALLQGLMEEALQGPERPRVSASGVAKGLASVDGWCRVWTGRDFAHFILRQACVQSTWEISKWVEMESVTSTSSKRGEGIRKSQSLEREGGGGGRGGVQKHKVTEQVCLWPQSV